MIHKLLKYEDWDRYGDFSLSFYNVETIVDLGGIKSGSKFEIVNLDFENGVLEFYKTGKEENSSVEIKLKSVEIKLKLVVDESEDLNCEEKTK